MAAMGDERSRMSSGDASTGKLQNVPSFGIRKGGGAGGRAAQEKMEALKRLQARAAKALATTAGHDSLAKPSTEVDATSDGFLGGEETFLTGGQVEHVSDVSAKSVSRSTKEETGLVAILPVEDAKRAALKEFSSIMRRSEQEFEQVQATCKEEHVARQRDMRTISTRIDALEEELLADRAALEKDLSELKKQMTQHLAIHD
jgi:hypothetical protein